MRRLLLTAIDSARKQGFDLAALIPASASLFEYYRTFGFTTSCFFSHSTYSFDSQTCNASAHRLLRLNGRSARRFFPFFARCFQQRNNCISFNSLHFHAAVADIILDNGDVFVLLDKPGGSPLALAFVLPAPPHSAGLPALPYVKEIVAIDESAQCAIFNHILRLHRAPSLFCRTPPDRNGCSPPLPYAMTLPLSLRASSLSSSGLYLNLMLD